MKKQEYYFLITIIFSSITFSSLGQEHSPDFPKEKQTTLGLYVTSAEAFHKWSADPDNVKILDIRTPEEYIFIGHAAMSWNIPAFDQFYEWDSEKERFPMKPNPDFVKKIKEVFHPNDIILVTCRSGNRSSIAVNRMAEAGFKNVFTITDGFEGDLVNEPESVFNGHRMVNGWKNSGLPYTYKVDPKLMLIPFSK